MTKGGACRRMFDPIVGRPGPERAGNPLVGLQLVPAGRTARLVEEGGVLVATGEATIDDQDVSALIDSGRR